MLPKRWHHGHSMFAGFVGGLAVAAYRVWLLIVLAFLVGAVAASAARTAARVLRWAGRRWAA